MSSRRLKFTLRVAGVILLVIAAVTFARSASFHTEEQPTPSGVTIDHVLEVGHITIILPLIALLLLALSFIVPSQKI